MSRFFLKEALVEDASRRDPNPRERTYQECCMLIALVEIREAIEVQTSRLSGVQEHWDESALAGLAARIDSMEHRLAKIAEQYNRTETLFSRVKAIERALDHAQGHQQEMAQLLTKLAEQVAGYVAPDKGVALNTVRVFERAPGAGEPTAG